MEIFKWPAARRADNSAVIVVGIVLKWIFKKLDGGDLDWMLLAEGRVMNLRVA
jgi:hypothetical protein